MKKENYVGVKWIPVMELLPGDDNPVLVTVYRKDEEGDPLVMMGRWSTMFKNWEVYEDDWTVNLYKVIAWMRMPEPYIDWREVPVDTKIYVKNNLNTKWIMRYFAKYEDGKVYAWDCGRTSWSAEYEGDVVSWRYAKVAEEENL